MSKQKQVYEVERLSGRVAFLPLLIALALVTANMTVADTYYVADDVGNDINSGTSWADAFKTIAVAVSQTVDGDTILVTNGTYAISAQITLDKGITLKSVNGFDATIIKGNKIKGARVLELSHADARAEGFTIRDGHTIKVGGAAFPGAGVMISPAGGTLLNCRVTGNQTSDYGCVGAGIGLYGGRVSNCVIDSNYVWQDSTKGCGVYQAGGNLENSLIKNNYGRFLAGTGSNNGGGVCLAGDNAVLRNCTIVGNNAGKGGGVFREKGVIQNCIIVDNTSGADTGDGAPNWNGYHASAWENICTPVNVGVNCITDDPVFVDAAANNYQLRLESPCIDAGKLLVGLPEIDLVGNPRMSGAGLDIGAYEYDTRTLSCGILASPEKSLSAAEVTLMASFTGFDASDPNELLFNWVFDDVAGTPSQSGFGLSVVKQLYNTLGHYHVRLTVSEASSGKTATTVHTNAVHIAPATLHLSQGNPFPVNPYDSWAKAATNISEVLAEAIDGSAVLISNGTYDVTQTIALNEGITLRGVNGWGETTLKGKKVTGVRILNLNHADAVVEGLTIRGGKSPAEVGVGSGVSISAGGGTLRHCLITDNDVGTHHTSGAGVAQIAGLVSSCIISNNARCEYAGGLNISGGICENTLVTDCLAAKGAGVRITGGILRNCTITENTADGTNSTAGGGINSSGGSVINCIIWGNTANNPDTLGYPDWADSSANLGGTEFKNTCTSVEVGENCLVADPLFKNVVARDYRLATTSPCRDQGLYQDWMVATTDLWGNPRVDGKQRVDIGAYELAAPPPFTLVVK